MIERWVAFWDRREAPYSLALVRILVGATLLADLLQAELFGVVGLLWGPPPEGAGFGQRVAPVPLAMRVLGTSTETGSLLWAVAAVTCLLFTLGVAYRVSSLLLAFVMVELGHIQPVNDSIDVLLRIVVPVLALSQAAGAWSFDAWYRKRRGRPAVESIPAWPRYLIVLQLLWLYISAGHQRDAKTWGLRGGFAAIGNVLGDPHFARVEPGSLAALYPLMCLGTFWTMLFELSAPLYLLWLWLERNPERGGRFGAGVRRFRVRWWWLLSGMSLHGGIAAGMKIGLFPFGILALYPAFLAPVETLGVRAALARWVERARGRS